MVDLPVPGKSGILCPDAPWGVLGHPPAVRAAPLTWILPVKLWRGRPGDWCWNCCARLLAAGKASPQRLLGLQCYWSDLLRQSFFLNTKADQASEAAGQASHLAGEGIVTYLFIISCISHKLKRDFMNIPRMALFSKVYSCFVF